MLHLVRHFGDQEDSGKPCGVCDVCDPEACLVRRFRAPDPAEAQVLAEILGALRQRDGQSTGQLFKNLDPGLLATGFDRKAFERLIGGLNRAGLLRVTEDEWEKDGKLIRFQRATLTPDGLRTPPEPMALAAFVQLAQEPAASGTRKRERKKKEGSSLMKKIRDRVSGASGGRRKETQDVLPGSESYLDEPLPGLVEALKAWRRTEAQRRRVPAFRILTDRTLTELAAARPSDEIELLEVRGIGPALVSKYGKEILGILAAGGG
jgi:DNA topoisomerase-3